jgi:hypothetical protein
MHRRTAATRLVALITLAALAASLVGTVAVQAREGRFTDRQLRINGDPEREAGRRTLRTVDVAKLPAASGKGSGYDPVLKRPDGNRSPAAPQGAVPAFPEQATSNGDPAITQATAFPGLAFAFKGATAGEPPDPWVAAGPEHVVQAVNRAFRISDRSGNTIQTIDMFDFFGLDVFYNPGDVEFFDPRVIYDSLHARWFAIEASFDCFATDDADIGTGYIDFAISDGPDPTAGWNILSVHYPDEIPDYPGLGTSTDKVVMSANRFALTGSSGPGNCDGAGYVGTELDVLAWSQLTATSGDINLDFFTSGTGFFTWRPSLQTPATSATVFAIAEDAGGDVEYARITGTPVNGSTAVTNSSLSSIIVPFLEPPQPFQPGPDQIENAVDERPTDAVWKDNKLAFVSTFPCDPVGGAVENRDCVRVSELSTATPASPTVIQDFLISQNTHDLYMGGVGYALNDDLHVVWTRSGEAAGHYPSSYAAYQDAAAANNSISARALLSAGTGPYGGSRWGDYVGVAQDPQVPNAVWQGNEFAKAGSLGAPNWGTEITQLQTGGTTFFPMNARVLDTRPGITVGLSGPFVHGVARSWQVAGFSSGGDIPADAVAVTGNLTVTNQTAGGYVSVTPAPNNNPASSTINFPVGDNRANNLTIPVNTDGKVSAVYRATPGKTTHLILDVTGYYLAGGGEFEYKTITPVRALDSRPGIGIGLSGPFQKDVPRELVIDTDDVPAAAVAITGNLTVTGQTGAGYLSISPGNDPTPPTSNLNFPVGDTRANGFTSAIGLLNEIWIVYKTTAPGPRSAHVILDITGYYINDPTGLLFYPLTPGRVMDTRSVPLSGLNGPFSSSTPRRLDVAGHWGAPLSAEAVTGNLTVVNQTAAGYVSATLTSEPNPTTSVLNFPLGDTRANGLTLPLNTGGRSWFVYKASPGKTTHLILDLSGYFD